VEEPANLLAGEKFRSFLGEVREHFDIILLDTPPILPVADTLSLRDQVDGFLFLYRTGFTPYALMRQAAEEVGEEKVLGVVLNGVAQQKQKYYSRYYGKYYHKPTGK
jgi:Mrp family chromosome partitioning ATPase